MPDFRKTRKVQVDVKLNGHPVPVSNLILTHELGTLPTAIIQTAMDNQSSGLKRTVKLDLDRIGRLNLLLQEKSCNHFSTATDLNIKVDDGDSGKIDFDCYSGRPSTSLVFGNLQIGLTGVHPQTVLNLFNPIIYRLQSYYAKTPDEVLPEVKRTNSLAERLDIYLRLLLARYEASQNIAWSFQSTPVHEMNKLALFAGVTRLLNSSVDSTRIIGLNHSGFDDRKVNRTLLDFLGSTPNFVGVIGRMQPEFLLQFNADWKGNAWLETIRNHEDPGPREIRAPIVEFSFDLAPQFQPPLVQVLVTGNSSRYYIVPGNNTGAKAAASGQTADQEAQTRMDNAQAFAASLTPDHLANDFHAHNSLLSLARYPATVPKNAAGRYELVNAPEWIYSYDFSRGDNVGQFITHRPVSAEQNFRGADSRLIEAAQHELDQCLALAVGQEVTGTILDWVARQVFDSLYLGSTSARVVIPLNLQLQVGRTYQMRAHDGKDLFTGFLASVVHNISIGGNGEEGAAYSTLGFSHVKAPGFDLDPRVAVGKAPLLISTRPDRPVKFTYDGEEVLNNLAGDTA